MIKYNPETWNLLILFKGTIIKKLFGGMFFITLLTTVLCFLHIEYKIINVEVSSAMPGYLGAALGLLLVFRNNTAYDKWWEARKVLGELVNVSRNFTININNLVPKENQERDQLYKLIIGFAFTLKEHLREGVKIEELHMVENDDLAKIISVNHKPNGIANLMLSKIQALYSRKILNEMQQYLLVKNINYIIDIMGKAERIKKTPIPIAYAFLLKLFIVIYVVMLPFGLLESLGWSVIPLTVMLYYLLMSIVMTAEEIEDPFGLEMNDLPVDDIANNIAKNVYEIMGEKSNTILDSVEV